jgi:hypothetical protein
MNSYTIERREMEAYNRGVRVGEQRGYDNGRISAPKVHTTRGANGKFVKRGE